MFGDNESVVNTASMPFSKLNKRHNALSYPQDKVMYRCKHSTVYSYLESSTQLTFSKHWDAPSVWKILRPILFTEGDDDDIPPITALKAYVKLITDAKQSL
jgi:hypothetical protein